MKFKLFFKSFLALIFTTCTYNALFAQNLNEIRMEIQGIMHVQEKCWNNADMEGYMQAYWQSDSLKFLSNNKITYGWNQQLERYKKSYPGKSEMGKLKFEIKNVEMLSKNNLLVIGTYLLKREGKEDAFGYYSLIWRKINTKWVIVFDHSS